MEIAKERIIVALDVDTQNEAIELASKLRDHVGLFKIGLELLNSIGIGIVQKIVDLGGQVFLDEKFHDIPNTVAGASKAVTRLGIKMFNIHTMGGIEMMKLAGQATKEEADKLNMERPLILGVTILTSIDQRMMDQELRISGDIVTQVVHLANLAERAGLDGVIASPHEIEAIHKSISEKMLIVTPGVRPSWAALQDQKRVMTPTEAILKGASYLVIGRPIIKPPAKIGTPVEAAKLIEEEIASALKEKGGNISDN
jgi:orotidine-5'-phosphate decarboxylase